MSLGLVVFQFVETESGLICGRPEYLKTLQAVQDGQFDVVVVYRMDRLGRDTADYFAALRTLRRLKRSSAKTANGPS